MTVSSRPDPRRLGRALLLCVGLLAGAGCRAPDGASPSPDYAPEEVV